ncbi:hypothetical protein THIOKS1600010 [Thiocapsa sp. KS1]|nr:hypothetical protein THIOKS1600010 [Thiocapsa sp. KS1]
MTLAGAAILEKTRVGKQTREQADALLSEATVSDADTLLTAVGRLGDELGALEWNGDLGQYELIADASTRGQFQLRWSSNSWRCWRSGSQRLRVRRCGRASRPSAEVFPRFSMDEIMARIERLSAERRQALFEWLAGRTTVA